MSAIWSTVKTMNITFKHNTLKLTFNGTDSMTQWYYFLTHSLLSPHYEAFLLAEAWQEWREMDKTMVLWTVETRSHFKTEMWSE